MLKKKGPEYNSQKFLGEKKDWQKHFKQDTL